MYKRFIFALLCLLLVGGNVQPIGAQENNMAKKLYKDNRENSPFYFDFFAKKLFGKFYQEFEIDQPSGSFYEQYTMMEQDPLKNKMNLAEQKGKLFHDEPIRLTFAGDAMMDWSVKETVKQKGADYPFVHIKEELASSDLSMVNLETSVTTGGIKQGKQYTFRSEPPALSGLKNAGFQLVSLANNHSLDFGLTGFRDTVASLKHYQLDYVGGGLNKQEAYQAKTYTLKGKTVKILAFSRVLPDYSWVATDTKPGLANGYDISLIESTIKKEKSTADFLFVFIHWGVETKRNPEPFQREWAKKMIDSGADGIIGSHPHVLQGFEYYKGKPIAYSLGNFLFPNYIKGNAAQTGILHIDIHKEEMKMTFVPFRISQDQIVKQSDQDKRAVWNELQELSYGGLTINNGDISENTTIAESNQ
ncbi:CapA family protein [Neobacillus drentensis]|uniref:CapA family protein n=1 Tax=Neobacillus drentensis TaxID=220684 RepID=UPI002FFF9D71